MISEFVGSVGMENFCWIMVLKDWKFVWVINKRNPNVWVTNRLQTNVTQTLRHKQVTNERNPNSCVTNRLQTKRNWRRVELVVSGIGGCVELEVGGIGGCVELKMGGIEGG